MLSFARSSGLFTSAARRLFIPAACSSRAPASRRWLRMGTRMSPSHVSVAVDPRVDVLIVPVLSDNFAYLIHDKEAKVAAVVDPVNPTVLLDLADSLGATVTTALVTHYHNDHAGGNALLARLRPDIEIVGSAYEVAPAVTVQLEHDAQRTLKGGNLSYKVLHTPCHTTGHLCFVTATATPALFCGDTLFVAGCGRFFEGDAADMNQSLNNILASLPDDCLVFCGHEYTVANLTFAQSVDPHNKNLEKKLEWAQNRISNDQHTVPSTIGEEKLYNPFMRPHIPEIAAAVGKPGCSAEEVMAALRAAKNAF